MQSNGEFRQKETIPPVPPQPYQIFPQINMISYFVALTMFELIFETVAYYHCVLLKTVACPSILQNPLPSSSPLISAEVVKNCT